MLYCSARLYGQRPTRFTPGFWLNTLVTTIILLGPAVADSANGKDVYQAFAIRFSLFLTVTLYAGAAVYVLDRLREHWRRKRAVAEPQPC